MVWAGFPCQPFSQTGNNEGLLDRQGRGMIILHIIRLLQHCMPRVVVLENVGGLERQTHHEFFEAVLKILKDIRVNGHHYIVEWKILDT